MAGRTLTEVNDALKHLMLQDLRIQCRARGISPAGSRQTLLERLGEHMMSTGDFTMKAEGSRPPTTEAAYGGDGGFGGQYSGDGDNGPRGNNYSRPSGQNVGNFMSDRPSSRVLAPPGGASQISFGNYGEASHVTSQRLQSTPKPTGVPYGTADEIEQEAPLSDFQLRAQHAFESDPPEGDVQYAGDEGTSLGGFGSSSNNNYSRPSGQNVGNFMSDRPSSRVLAPPGGATQISFG